MIRDLKRNRQKIGYIARCPAQICLTRIIPLIVRHDRRHKGTRRECWTELAWTTEQLRNKGQSGDNIIITLLRIFQKKVFPCIRVFPCKVNIKDPSLDNMVSVSRARKTVTKTICENKGPQLKPHGLSFPSLYNCDENHLLK